MSTLPFVETELPGVFEVHGRRFEDARGYFTEVHSERTWRAAGIDLRFVQDNLSQSSRGVLRGMHYQINPHAQGKFVRVLHGAAFDVAVDLRQGSPTFGRWTGRTLSAANALGLWIPPGFAHGFLALDDATVLFYKCTGFYEPTAERTLHYADPAVGIAWPETPHLVAPRDEAAPRLADTETNFSA